MSVDEKTNSEEKEYVDAKIDCFITIASFYGINISKAQIKHSYAVEGEMTDTDLLRVSSDIGLKSKIATVSMTKIKDMVLPAIAKLKDGSYVIIASANTEKLLLAYPNSPTPKLVDHRDFEEVYAGRLILFTKRGFKKSDVAFGLKWFIPDIIKYKRPLLHVILASFTMQILGLFSPMMIQVVIDKVLVHNSYTTLDVLAVGLLLIAVFETMMSMARTYLFSHTTSRIDVMLGARLFKHLFSLPYRYFEARRVGDTIARVRELENIRTFLTGAPLTSVLDVLFIVVYIVVMFLYSTKLTWVVLLSLPLFVVLSVIVTPIFRARLKEKFEYGARENSYLVETVSGVQTIKSFALEPQIQKKWEEIISKYITSSFKTGVLAGNASAIASLIQKAFDIIILWMGAHLVIEGNLTVGALIAFRMLSSRVSTPVLRLVQMWQDFQQTGISIERLGDIFGTKPEPSVDASKVTLPSIRGDIRFERVRFRYNVDSSEVIRNMSFTINAGEVIGIVGRSGSGKSTISKLLQRLYIPEAGKILVDGIDIALADPAWLRRQIGVVLQENFLFNATIRENITVHAPSSSIEDIIAMCKISGAHDFILELPNGYDTMVGENGTGLSGGQKQRVAIARALLCNPKILIFDEATSALDYESESIIQQNLQEICKGRTVIIIAHRLSTLKDVDKIMAIDRGELVEYGRIEELLEKKGLYYYLHSMQESGRV